MAAVTPTKKLLPMSNRTHNQSAALMWYGTGSANTDATLTTDTISKDYSYRISYVTAAYSGSPTQTGVTVALDSALGSGYDATITTGSANAKFTAYTPSGNVIVGPGDALVITALAGGSGQTAAIVVVLEPI